MTELTKEQKRELGVASGAAALAPEHQQQLQRLEQKLDQRAEEKAALNGDVRGIHADLNALDRSLKSLDTVDCKDPEQLAEQLEQLEQLEQKLIDTQFQLDEVKGQESFLKSVAKDEAITGDATKLEALMNQLDQDPCFRAMVPSNLLKAAPTAVEKNDERAALNIVRNELQGSTDPGAALKALKALDEFDRTRKLLDEFATKLADRSEALGKVRDQLSGPDPVAGRDAALKTINELPKDRLEIVSLGNQKIADLPSLNAAWIAALDSGSQTYGATRRRFWESMNPGPNKQLSEVGDAARKTIEAAGYTFEGLRPGNAPVLAADKGISKNERTLSIQHHHPQHLSKEPELASKVVDPKNLRFSTMSDNTIEDTKYLKGPVATASLKMQDRLESTKADVRELLRNPGVGPQARAELERITKLDYRDLETRALSSNSGPEKRVGELDGKLLIAAEVVRTREHRQVSQTGLSAAEQSAQQKSTAEAKEAFAALSLRSNQTLLQLSAEVSATISATQKHLEDFANERTKEQMEAKAREEIKYGRMSNK